ncbi:MAG: sugar transferase [Planctomycetota bacterium]|nr:sugar transferase [Planctomycetota bacterium]
MPEGPLERKEGELSCLAVDIERIVDEQRQPLRRAADIAASVAALVVLAPVLALVALAVCLDSRGPVFYTQRRIGLNRRRRADAGGAQVRDRRTVVLGGQPFVIWKFRTMRMNAEASGPQWARVNDDRVTRVGRLLRRTRLDEVPQFFNVLKGEMTLIGPRPERAYFIRTLELEIPHYSKRLLVKPGITGLAQVNNGYDDSLDSVRRKLTWDLRYLRNRGLGADLVILAQTCRTVLMGHGAK